MFIDHEERACTAREREYERYSNLDTKSPAAAERIKPFSYVYRNDILFSVYVHVVGVDSKHRSPCICV